MELEISHMFKNFIIFYEAPRSIGMLRRTHCWVLESKRETKCEVTSFPSSTLSLMIIMNNTVFVSGWILSVVCLFKSVLFYLLTVGVEGDWCTLSHSKTHTQTSGRTPLDEGSARHRDFYLHNTQHSQETKSIIPAGFEPAITASEQPQTCALDLCHFSG